MNTALRVPREEVDRDQVVRLHGVPWSGYEALLTWRGETSVPRITYLRGELELMCPGRNHEIDKTKLARLIEAWAEEVGIDLEGIGSWTLKNSREERGAEPDECYAINRVIRSDEDRPDFAIEVVYTSGGIDKLAVYASLGVREVWLWEGEKLDFHVARAEGYERVARSELLPELDPELFAACMEVEPQTAAVRELRRRLRG